MRVSTAFVLVSLGSVIACGRETAELSTPQARVNVQSDHFDPAAIQDLIQRTRVIMANGSGSLTARQIFSTLPLDSSGIETLIAAYPTAAHLSCRNSVCQVSGAGRPAQVDLLGQAGLLRNPKLVVGNRLGAAVTLTGSGAIKLCNIRGVKMKKYFVEREIQGVLASVAGGRVSVTANTRGSDDFVCP